uniref:Glycosyl transferase family 2 n=1 Tax=Cyanothece sp. (strain PCC 7425 / ATCC 29141) TaxID=395961 RepID=B8HLJ5_CYAP4
MPAPAPPLTDLPAPLHPGVGWPWLAQPKSLPELQPNGREWPKITIVTPSFNQGHFIEATIRSVLLQGYPNLEYLVLDGGSTDNSVEIIKKYEPWLTFWTSEPDGGQSGAINRGLRQSTGEWFNWLNSDDILLPNALINLATIAALAPNCHWISGGRLLISADGDYIDQYLPWRTNPLILGLNYPGYFPQDSTFFRLDWVRSQGIELREDLHNVMDTFLYFQLMALDRPLLTTATFSAMRLHEAQKGARLDKLKLELQQAIYPLWQQTDPQAKRLFNLLHQPFGIGIMGRSLLRLAMQYNLVPSLRQWSIAVFSPQQQQWQLTTAAQVRNWL